MTPTQALGLENLLNRPGGGKVRSELGSVEPRICEGAIPKIADLLRPSGVMFAARIMLEAAKLPDDGHQSMYPRIKGVLNR